MTFYCKDLENSLDNIVSMIRDVHGAVDLYVEKPVYGRFLSDLEKKQDKFLEILENINIETKKVRILESEIESWSEGTLGLIWKDQFKTNVDKIKSIKATNLESKKSVSCGK